jgi:hypothetical protein
MKNSPAALLLGPGVDYTKLNYLHRWAGRGLFIGAVIHGALWIQNHLVSLLVQAVLLPNQASTRRPTNSPF